MKIAIIFLVVAVIVGASIYFNQLSKQEQEPVQTEETTPQAKDQTSPEPPEPAPQAPFFGLIISSTSGGSVTTPGEGTFVYNEGTVVDLVAVPNDGCDFINWTGDSETIADVNSTNTTITINSDYSITANFKTEGAELEPVPESVPSSPFNSLTTSSTLGGSVTTPGEGTFVYDIDKVVSLVAVPNSGYNFINWTGNTETISNVNSTNTTIVMSGDYSVTANFGKAQSLEPEPTPQPPAPKPAVSINTYITSGPAEGEVINDTDQVVFEFRGEISPKETEGKITFETKVEGLDKDWQKTSYQKRTINFPSGPKEYTFLVRAKTQDLIDSTPAQRTFKINISPYFEKIKIYSIKTRTSSRPYSLITLTTSLDKEEEINITGWQIKGTKGGFIIPTGIEKGDPHDNLTPGGNIIIKQGDKIYLSGAPNPLGKGRNFRPNECLGYLTNYYNFPISLSKDCPKPEAWEISHLSLCCQEYILDLKKCELPDFSQQYGGVLCDVECSSYLRENVNYTTCFNKHYRDEDFLDKEWHIYMEKDFLSAERDMLSLLDQNGLVVDTYLYGTCD